MQNVTAFIQAVLYALSTFLLTPVMLLLVALAAWTVVYAGTFMAEWAWRIRRRRRRGVEAELADIRQSGVVNGSLRDTLSMPVRRYLDRLQDLILHRDRFLTQRVETLIQTSEYDLTRSLDRLKVVVKTGPALGLIGTLIPMSTGLAALIQGNVSQVSSNLVIAFTTTIVGLAVGMTAFVFVTAKARWVQEDIRAMELLAEALVGEESA